MSETNIPDKLKEISESRLVEALLQAQSKKSNLNINRKNSLFGKVYKTLTGAESTLADRLFLHQLWATKIKPNSLVGDTDKEGNRNKRKTRSKDSDDVRVVKQNKAASKTRNKNPGIFKRFFNNLLGGDTLELLQTQANFTERCSIGNETNVPEPIPPQQTTTSEDDELERIIQAWQKDTFVYPTYPCPICKRYNYQGNSYVRSFTFNDQLVKHMADMGFNEFSVGQTEIICRRCFDNLSKYNANVEIKVDELESLQPQQVNIQHEQVSNPQINRERVFSQPSMGYKRINDDRFILHGTMNQGALDKVPGGGGSQCCAMCATAICHALIQPIETWGSHLVDSILIQGDEYYGQLRPTRTGYLEPAEVQGNIKCFGNVTVSLHVTDEPLFGMLNKIKGRHHNRLPDSISSFLNSENHFAILTAIEYCMALIKCNGDLYLFDSHSRGEKGHRSESGTACVAKFTGERIARDVSTLVHHNCTSGRDVNANMSTQELEIFQYFIHPVICEIQAPQNNQEEILDEEFLDDDMVNEEVNTIASSRPLELFGMAESNGVVLDCVITYDEPTLEEFQEAVKSNTDIINPINLTRARGRPLYPDKEKHLEELAFVKLFPHGQNGFSETRKIPITILDYFQQRIMGNDSVFHDNEYLFYALNRVESHILQQKIAVCGNMRANNGEVDEYENQLPAVDNVHLYMEGIRGSGSYWKKYTSKVLTIIEQLGVPTFFLTISYDDLNSEDSITALYKAKYGADATLPGPPESIPFEERRQLLNNYPVASSRHFDHKVKKLFQLISKQGKYLFGAEVEDFTYRIEFQARGSPHVHALIWTDFKYDFQSAEGIKFIEKNISCSLNTKFWDLVERYQNHMHKDTCFKNFNICRFGFPRKISDETKILDDDEIARSHGRFVDLKRTREEIMINNYHPKLLPIVKCNMDIQVVTGTKAIAYYVGKYISKAEPMHVRQEIKDAIIAAKSNKNSSFYQNAMKIASTIIKNRELSAPEASWRLCHLPLRKSTRGFVFIPSFLPEKRIRLIRRDSFFMDEPKVGLNIIDRYIHRPNSLQHLSLIEFAAWWKPCSKPNIDEPEESEEVDETTKIYLKNRKGAMVKRKRHAIVRSPRFKQLQDSEDYLYSMILLYYPFQKEDFLVPFSGSVQDAFMSLKDQFRSHADDPIINPELGNQIESVLLQYATFSQETPDFDAEIEQNLNMFFDDDDSDLTAERLFEPVNEDIGFQERLAQMNSGQRRLFEKLRQHLLQPEGFDNLMLFIQGTAGVGKSFLISLMEYIIKTLHPAKERALIKAAPTGVAARNINGVTLHKAFSLGVEQHGMAQYLKLGSRALHDKRLLMKDVKYVFIDETSMISYQTYRMISLRLGEIFNNNKPFGGLNVIVFGDLLQLKPVRGNWCFDRPNYFRHELHLWRIFKFEMLTKVMRQNDADEFYHILQKLRIGTMMKSDVEKLRERLLDPKNRNFENMNRQSKESLHLYPKVCQVEAYNKLCLQDMQTNGVRLYNANCVDLFGNGIKYCQRVPESLLYKDDRKCAGISRTLILAEGGKYMLKWNIEPLAGLCNGSLGILRGIKWTALRRYQLGDGDLPEFVYVEFEGKIGQHHLSRTMGYENCVEIRARTFEFIGKRGVKVFRTQLPLTPSFSVSIHKSQGMSLDSGTVHLGRHIFTFGLASVALSRIRTFEGLYVTDICETKLLVNKNGSGPCNPTPLRELYRLILLEFLDMDQNNYNVEFINELVEWTIEYVFC